MSTITLTSQTVPSSSVVLRQLLQDALEHTSPLEDFIQLVRDLMRFELQYGLNSQDFFSRFKTGEMGDAIDFMRWANKYEMYQEMKGNMEHLFELLGQYAIPCSVTA